MESSELSDLCIESCEALLDYIAERRRTDDWRIGLSEIAIRKYDVKDDYVILYARTPILDTTFLLLKIGNQTMPVTSVDFDKFDSVSMSMVIYTTDEIRERLKKHGADVSVITDLKWLVKITREFYKKYRNYIEFPKVKPSFSKDEYSFPKDSVPLDEQVRAVDTILNNSSAYIWGAPGTGKTQLVLATAILAYVKQGKRVAVIAPTNNSLEQVLRGLMNIITKEDPQQTVINRSRDILRIGSATKEFLNDYSDICEKRGITRQIILTESTIDVLRNVLFFKQKERLQVKFDELRQIYKKHTLFRKKSLDAQAEGICKDVESILKLSSDIPVTDFSATRENYESKIQEIKDFIFQNSRPEANNEHYKDWSAEQVREELIKQEAELAKLKKMDPEVKCRTAKILAMTPQKFMMRFGPEYNGDNVKLSVDHVFVDEVGYSNLIQTMSLFSLGVPVTFLGDHLQLQPVCEINRGDIVVDIREDQVMKDGYVWEQSALYAESMFTKTAEQLRQDYLDFKEPTFELTARCDLTASHRFGKNLAEILDRCVYHNGLHSTSTNNLEIVCIDTYCKEKGNRSNPSEAEAVRSYIEENKGRLGSFAVLSPYNVQVDLITKLCPEYKNSIMTIHKSQGREWDTVIMSIADNRVRIAGKEHQLHLTSTLSDNGGIYVMNTAVSRAKKRLVIVCDRDYWSRLDGELVGEMASNADILIDRTDLVDESDSGRYKS